MARVLVDIEEVMLDDEVGREVPGVEATCQKCNHSTDSFGISDKSRRRCLVLLRQECPLQEKNFYIDASVEDEE